MTLKELRDKLAAIAQKLEQVNSKCVGADGNVRALTDEEQKEYSALEGEAEAVRAAIKRAEAIEAARSDIKALNEPEKKIPQVTVTRAERHDEKGNYRGYRSLGEQLRDVSRAGTPGGRVDERLHEIRAASGLNESIDSQGAFLLQPDFMLDLQRDTYSAGAVAQLCRRIPISSNSIELPQIDESSRADGSRGGGVRGYWRAEAATVTASKPTFRSSRIVVDDLMAIAYATDQLLEDVPALDAYIRQEFVEEMAFKLDDAIINGDGSGKPLGILHASCLVVQAKESNQTADTIVWNNISKMQERMFASGRAKATWLTNTDCMTQLRSLYIPIGSTAGVYTGMFQAKGQYGNPSDMLDGIPLAWTEQAATLGDLGDIILGDFSQYYLVEKGTIDAQTSIHVRFLYGENTFRFVMRVGGQPRRLSAVTPYKGSNTKSDFVVLAARA